jgi:hypothetical protein
LHRVQFHTLESQMTSATTWQTCASCSITIPKPSMALPRPPKTPRSASRKIEALDRGSGRVSKVSASEDAHLLIDVLRRQAGKVTCCT